MNDEKKVKEEKKPIKDEMLDKVNAGFIIEGPRTPVNHSKPFPPGHGPRPC